MLLLKIRNIALNSKFAKKIFIDGGSLRSFFLMSKVYLSKVAEYSRELKMMRLGKFSKELS